MRASGLIYSRQTTILIAFFFAALMFTLAAPSVTGSDVTPTPTPGENALRYDGLYTAANYDWLRFYEDGVVLSISGQVNPNDVSVFSEYLFNDADCEGCGRGTYSIEGTELKFSTADSSETFNFEGSIEADTLTLNIHYLSTGHKDTRVYQFVELPAAALTPISTVIPTSSSLAPAAAALRYDGLYHEMNSFGWLRFFEDGTVLTIPLQGAAAGEALEWLSPDCEDCGRGTYSVQDSEIKFSSTTAQGTVDYEGIIQADALTLDTLSHINGNQRTGVVFRFIDPAAAVALPTARPTPNPTLLPDPGVLLQICTDGTDDFLIEVCPGAGQWFLYGDDPKEFRYPLTGDIQGDTYSFRLWLASAGTTTFEVTSLVLHDDEETILASASFTADSQEYQEFTATVEGIDPATAEGDTLVVRVSSSSALQAGQIRPGGLAYGADMASLIKIPPVE